MSIAQFETQIRDRINARRLQHQLLSRGADWNKLCSALDVIEDTELGLDAYLNHAHTKNPGICYLHVYGALQLLQTQQDAVAQICSVLGVKPQTSPKIPEVSEVRSSAVGHPVAQKEDETTKSNFIVRSSLSQYGFNLMTVFSDNRQFVERSVNMPKLIDEQRSALAKALQEVIFILDEAEMKHREKFRDEKLVDCFPPALGYYFSKILKRSTVRSIILLADYTSISFQIASPR